MVAPAVDPRPHAAVVHAAIAALRHAIERGLHLVPDAEHRLELGARLGDSTASLAPLEGHAEGETDHHVGTVAGRTALADGAEAFGVVNGDVGKDLAVYLDVRLVQAIDQAAVGQTVQARGSIDARNPQSAELAFALLMGLLATGWVGLRRVRA